MCLFGIRLAFSGSSFFSNMFLSTMDLEGTLVVAGFEVPGFVIFGGIWGQEKGS